MQAHSWSTLWVNMTGRKKWMHGRDDRTKTRCAMISLAATRGVIERRVCDCARSCARTRGFIMNQQVRASAGAVLGARSSGLRVSLRGLADRDGHPKQDGRRRAVAGGCGWNLVWRCGRAVVRAWRSGRASARAQRCERSGCCRRYLGNWERCGRRRGDGR